MKKHIDNRITLAVLAIVLFAAGWALFRPEALVVNRTVNEALPVAAATQTEEPSVLALGTFESCHKYSVVGTAELVRTADGRRYIQLRDLDSSNGPDLHVTVLDAQGNRVDLGELKGNKGTSFYEVDANLTDAQLDTVEVWCRRFDRTFGVADLMKA